MLVNTNIVKMVTMDENNDLGGAIVGLTILLIILACIAVYGLLSRGAVSPAMAVGIPLSKTVWNISKRKSKDKSEIKKKPTPKRVNKVLKLISAPVVGLGLGILTNMFGIAVATAFIPTFGTIVGGALGVVSGVLADFIPHCVQELWHCVANKNFPKGKTKRERIAKFFKGPILGCGVSFLTNTLAIGISGLVGSNLIGAISGAIADVAPHTIQEIHAHSRSKTCEAEKVNCHPCEAITKEHIKPRECISCVLHRLKNKKEYTPPCYFAKAKVK